MTMKQAQQEAFDKAVRGLASQKFARSVDSGGERCLYNGPDGKHCAFGWLITNVKLDDEDNNLNTYDLAKHSVVNELLESIGTTFARSLQRCHDGARFRPGYGDYVDLPDMMVTSLRSLAIEYDLSTTVLDEVASAATP